jgi:co-chaperonin GroES (HSP10)
MGSGGVVSVGEDAEAGREGEVVGVGAVAASGNSGAFEAPVKLNSR